MHTHDKPASFHSSPQEAMRAPAEEFFETADDRNLDAGAREQLLAGIPVAERRLLLAGVSTSVLEGGVGNPLLLLHGPGGYGAMWRRVIPDLTTTHRVIAPDLPGHGASTVADGPLDAGRVISWLGKLIEHTCPTPPILVGHLVGGAIAARFAADHGDRVDRLVLVVPLGLAPFQPSPAFGAALTGFLAQPSADTHDDLWKHCVFDLEALQRQPAARWELMKAYNLDRARTASASGALQALMEQFGIPAIPEAVLGRIAAPTSLIWGRHDSIIPLSVAEAASTRYRWPLYVIENAGNEPAIEAPEAFLRALRTALVAPTRGQVAS
jgi:pimeloyl-ACP methyl ester carboxylesterase